MPTTSAPLAIHSHALTHLMYTWQIRIEGVGAPFLVFRRFSQLYDLQLLIKERFPNIKLAPFPSKILFMRSQVSVYAVLCYAIYYEWELHVFPMFVFFPSVKQPPIHVDSVSCTEAAR